MNTHPRRMLGLAAVALVSFAALAACGSDDSGSADAATADTTATGATATPDAPADTPGVGGDKIGFIFVGPKDDYGYNQAAYEGSQAVAEAHPDMEVITAENVPESDEATRVMEQMIDRGARIIFATSYGHLDPAMKVAEAHPDVVVVQQGNFIQGAIPPNAGTYFGTVYEPVYLAGIAAGAATESNKLGYVYAFPIPQTIANINAFELGAKVSNPDAETYTVNTSNWCDPAKQAEAAQSLIAQGVDVITQHQDCTATITKAAEEAGIKVVGYHADASSLAPEGWLTGSEWAWGDLYNEIVDTALAGEFIGSAFNANYRVGYQTGENPFVQSTFGPDVTEETKAEIEGEKERISTTGSVFEGPIYGQDGTTVLFPAGVPDYAETESMNTAFVEGVIGDIPKG